MKVLVSTDGSPGSQAALDEICRRPWPPDTRVKILSVAHTIMPEAADPLLVASAAHAAALEEAHRQAVEATEKAADQLRERAPQLPIEVHILEGSPKKHIVEEAKRWGADLIILGAHGRGRLARFLLGSVSQAVALHAPCSVEIVRSPPATHGAGAESP
jgi:nucleotide-binding universal stress UspA family protein